MASPPESVEKTAPAQHVEEGNLAIDKDPITEDIYDEARNKKLNRRLDLRILPLCCWVYLLNFLGMHLAFSLHSHLTTTQIEVTLATPRCSIRRLVMTYYPRQA
jgi:hypothetical protein